MLNQTSAAVPAENAAERPASLTLALRVIDGLLLLGAVTVLLVIVRQDDLIRVWAEGNAATKDLLLSHGLDAVKEGSVTPPRFIPVALTLYVVLAGLVAILAVFLRHGFEWARVSLTGLLALATVAALAGMRVGQPTLFTVLSIVLIALFLVLMVPLWHRATTAFLHRPLGPVEADADA